MRKTGIAISLLTALAGGCAATSGAGTARSGETEFIKIQSTAAAGYVETVPGTVVKLEMIGIPGGNIALAQAVNCPSKETVKVKPLWISKTEVPWELYDLFVYGLENEDSDTRDAFDGVTYPTKPYIAMDRSFGHAGFPAISMSARGAENFCRWLSARTKKTYRLPTEAEWRFACAAGGTEIPPNSKLSKEAWLADDAAGKTHPCGAKSPNAFGLLDMIGNACEWAIGVDGKPVTLGGNYRDAAGALAGAFRVMPVPDWNRRDPQVPKSVWWFADGGFVGFRVVREND